MSTVNRSSRRSGRFLDPTLDQPVRQRTLSSDYERFYRQYILPERELKHEKEEPRVHFQRGILRGSAKAQQRRLNSPQRKEFQSARIVRCKSALRCDEHYSDYQDNSGSGAVADERDYRLPDKAYPRRRRGTLPKSFYFDREKMDTTGKYRGGQDSASGEFAKSKLNNSGHNSDISSISDKVDQMTLLDEQCSTASDSTVTVRRLRRNRPYSGQPLQRPHYEHGKPMQPAKAMAFPQNPVQYPVCYMWPVPMQPFPSVPTSLMCPPVVRFPPPMRPPPGNSAPFPNPARHMFYSRY